jgi:hypothetical protein
VPEVNRKGAISGFVIDPNIIIKVRYLCRVEPFLASRLALRWGIFIEGAISGFTINIYPCYSGVASMQGSRFWLQNRRISLLSGGITVCRGSFGFNV